MPGRAGVRKWKVWSGDTERASETWQDSGTSFPFYARYDLNFYSYFFLLIASKEKQDFLKYINIFKIFFLFW